MKKEWCVYKHTSPNGKHYIGITKQKPSLRWRGNGQGYKNCPVFYNAIKKYGWNNFKHEILYENLTKEEAEKKEKEFIIKYNSLVPYGYNIDKGGYTGNKFEKSIYMLSIKNGEIIREFKSIQEASEYLLVDRSSISRAIIDKHTCRGNLFIYTSDYSKNNVAKLLDKNKIKEVYQYEYDTHKFIKKYSSVIEASIETNTNRSNISSCLSNVYKSANGYIWSRNEISDFSYFERKTNKKQIDVFVYTEDGNFYKKYLSVPDASKDLNIAKEKIHRCLKSKYDLVLNGFVFLYNKRNIKPVIKGHGTLAETIYQFDLEWNLINSYKSASQAAKSIINKDKSSTIISALLDHKKTAYGFHWMKESDLFLLDNIK